MSIKVDSTKKRRHFIVGRTDLVKVFSWNDFAKRMFLKKNCWVPSNRMISKKFSLLFSRSKSNSEILANPHSFFDPEYSIPINERLSSMIFGRQNFFRKLIEDLSNEEASKLFSFLIWENPKVSKMIFDEMLRMVSLTKKLSFSSSQNKFLRTDLKQFDFWRGSLCRSVSPSSTHWRFVARRSTSLLF